MTTAAIGFSLSGLGDPNGASPRPWADFQPRAATDFWGALARIFHRLDIAEGLQDDLRTLAAFLSDFAVDHAYYRASSMPSTSGAQ